MRLTTPETIRTLQRKLYQKAKQEPGYRFYALYDKVYRPDILAHAYRLVKAAGGCAGADGRNFEDIERNEGVKVRSWKEGYQRFPSTRLYADYGLYKVPTTAGWTAKAHAI